MNTILKLLRSNIRWIILTGENGSGKTSLLDSIKNKLVHDMATHLAVAECLVKNNIPLDRIGEPIAFMYEQRPVVIIDDFGSRLHPKLARELSYILYTELLYIQFVIATHNPMILLGVNNVDLALMVVRKSINGISLTRLTKLEKELVNLLPNVILTSPLFGLDDISNVYLTDEEFDNAPMEDKYDDIESNKKMMQELEELANNKVLFPDDLFKKRQYKKFDEEIDEMFK